MSSFFQGMLSMLNPMTVVKQSKSFIKDPVAYFKPENAFGLLQGKTKEENAAKYYDPMYDEKRPPAAVLNYRLGAGTQPPPPSSGPIEDAMLARQQGRSIW